MSHKQRTGHWRGHRRGLAAVVLAAIAGLTGCADLRPAGQPATADSQTMPAAPPLTSGCLAPAQLNNRLTPPLLYRSLASCIDKQRYPEAVALFALAGSYTWYDALRLDSDAARQAHSQLLALTLRPLNKARQQAFWQLARQQLQQQPELAAVCQRVLEIGKPAYQPTYLLPGGDGNQHSAAAADSTASEADWRAAVNGYLHCTTDILVIP